MEIGRALSLHDILFRNASGAGPTAVADAPDAVATPTAPGVQANTPTPTPKSGARALDLFA